MRYDPMLSTALMLNADDAGTRIAQWRQLVDLVVQADGRLSAELRDTVLDRIQALRVFVPLDQRRLAATQLAARATHGDGVAFFATDDPVVAAPILSVAQLDGGTWQDLIPQMPPTSRAILRNRRDLPDAAVRALASFGLADFALPANDVATADAGTQIRDLVARIEAFRLGNMSVSSDLAVQAPSEDFSFETATDGLFNWVAGAPREALIGLGIGEIAVAGGFGVDGQAAGAFRRRAPFADARLLVAGAGPAGGNWLISAKPVFNPADGRFAGYHGTARRPRSDEMAGPVGRFAGTTMPVDSLRQLIHELRTPLNAVLGFAEMIDRQLLGPAAEAYRVRARDIVRDGERLLIMVDDLDQAAHGRRHATSDHDNVDVQLILKKVEAGLQLTLASRDVGLVVLAGQSVIVRGMNTDIVERMMARLIAAAVALAAPGETIEVTLSDMALQGAVLSIARPVQLKEVSDEMLLDPGYDPALPYPDAPLLGLGFTLHLVRSLAHSVGGLFKISPQAFVLALPTGMAIADLPAGTP